MDSFGDQSLDGSPKLPSFAPVTLTRELYTVLGLEQDKWASIWQKRPIANVQVSYSPLRPYLSASTLLCPSLSYEWFDLGNCQGMNAILPQLVSVKPWPVLIKP